MNLLEKIMSILNFEDWKKASDLPGWAHRPTRMKHLRRPHSSSRIRGSGAQCMTIEEYDDKDERNARFAALRAQGTRHVSKFSTVRNDGLDDTGRMKSKSVWCVVRP
jgi:hypothetical protein